MTLVSKSSEQIHLDVLHQLKCDPTVDEAEVGVQVHNGVVTLTGIVDAWPKRVAAQLAAHRVAGVLDVANEILVQPAGAHQRSDAKIAEAVRRTLEWDVFIPDESIHSTVAHGVVFLEGEVVRPSQRDDASKAIRNLAGVVGVVNRITVRPQEHVDVRELMRTIAEALERQVAREARTIDVHASGGTVSVTGRVRSWAEREAVLGAARSAYGVTTVEDNLQIDSFGRAGQQHHVV